MTARTLAFVVSALLATSIPAAEAPSGPAPLLVVLQPTGSERDGLPVYTRHPDAAAVEAVLARGFSGRLLRHYRVHQSEHLLR